MKVTIIAVLVALGVAVVSANAVAPENLQRLDVDYTPETAAKGFLDSSDNFCIFSKFFWVARAALRTLKGVNCSIKHVMIIKSTGEQFLNDLQNCGSDAVNAYKNVIKSVKAVIATCNNIINLNERVCHNDGSTANESKSTPWKCLLKLVRQLYTLNKQIKSTMAAIKKVPSIPGDALQCSNNAVNPLTTAFVSFPDNVKTCSKLSSN